MNVAIKEKAKSKSRALNARHRAAIRRCKTHMHRKNHVTVYVKKNYWTKVPIKVYSHKPKIVKKVIKVLAPRPKKVTIHKVKKVVLKSKRCIPGPKGKPCFFMTAKKFMGPVMVHSHNHYADKKKKVVKSTPVAKKSCQKLDRVCRMKQEVKVALMK